MKKRFLIAVNLFLVLLLAGCNSDSDNKTYAAQPIHEHDKCHMCGMMITKYPGPKAEIAFKDTDAMPKFCSVYDMFSFALQPENKRRIAKIFVHDMAKTYWENPEDKYFIDAETAWYVYGTSRKAVMGPAVAPFSTKDAAEKFISEWGGRILTYEDITLDLLKTDK